jgi:CelD/BcsL family acetyltransferase involved in cellulose biosynthesis
MYNVTHEDLASLSAIWKDRATALDWNCPFVVPPWLATWWRLFGTGSDLHIAVVRDEGHIIGVAPLKIDGKTASIIGSKDVCDYLDFIVGPGREDAFSAQLIDHLTTRGIARLDLGLLRPDSFVLTRFATFAQARGCQVITKQEDVTYETELPADWEAYLQLLNTKQRHEVRRKLRRLPEGGQPEFALLRPDTAPPESIDSFMRLFSLARDEAKAAFMTPAMEAFFRSLAQALAAESLLRLGVLRLDGQPVAMVMCFDYNGIIYLYNSGFDPQHQWLSVGLLSKVLSIKQSIEEGKRRFEFLKGNEVYKHHLGGKELPLIQCDITLS